MKDSTSDSSAPLQEIVPVTGKWVSFPLLSKTTLVEPDSERGILPIRRFTFGYPADKSLDFTFTTQVLKLVRGDTGKHKSYSPTSEADKKGSFDLTIKIYPGGGHSQWLDEQPIGTRVTMFGPMPPPPINKIYSPGKRVIVIALGIGITEAYTTCREELRKSDDTTITLVNSVRWRDELVLKEEINELLKEYPDRFDVRNITTKEKVDQDGWINERLNSSMIEGFVGDGVEKEDVRLLVVGTKEMMGKVWDELKTIGFDFDAHTLVKKPSPITILSTLLHSAVTSPVNYVKGFFK